jgi:hypothetical protein
MANEIPILKGKAREACAFHHPVGYCSFISFIQFAESCALNFSDKILLRSAESSFSSLKFLRLFWGEQPPFTPIGCGGR